MTYCRWRQEFGGLKTDPGDFAARDAEVAELTLDEQILSEAARGDNSRPARRRACIEHVRRVLPVSERRACAALGQHPGACAANHRSTQRKRPRGRDDEDRLVADIIELARQYGRYGCRKVTALLRDAGW